MTTRCNEKMGEWAHCARAPMHDGPHSREDDTGRVPDCGDAGPDGAVCSRELDHGGMHSAQGRAFYTESQWNAEGSTVPRWADEVLTFFPPQRVTRVAK